jgi:hypothetical protein
MSDLLNLIIEREIAIASRGLADETTAIDADAGAKGQFRSGARIKRYLRAYAASSAKATSAVFRVAEASYERTGVSLEEARELAVESVQRYIGDLRDRIPKLVQSTGMNGVDSAAARAAMEIFQTIQSDFDGAATLYRAGMDEPSAIGKPATHNVLNVSGSGHTIVAQQGSPHAHQAVHISNEVHSFAASLDEAPLSKGVRNEAEALLNDLKAETAKPIMVRDKGRITSLLDGISKTVGIASGIASPQLVEAFHGLLRAFG